MNCRVTNVTAGKVNVNTAASDETKPNIRVPSLPMANSAALSAKSYFQGDLCGVHCMIFEVHRTEDGY